MASVTIRFYEELNDFLPSEKRRQAFSLETPSGCTVKALIEDLGVPHTEIDLILANGESVDFAYQPETGDRISVYPKFESWDIGPLSRVRPVPLRETRFALDVHLGRLARLLRMFGFDSFYGNAVDDEELVRAARLEKRIVLTRDRGLLKRRNVTHGYLVRSGLPREQLGEVVRRFDLFGSVRLGTRCVICNVALDRVPKEVVLSRVPPAVARDHEDFAECPSCHRVFWRGTHWQTMTRLAGSLGISADRSST
ncbi:MAG TPA: Mut7-C RNAse domain-containing protein [Spirochaetia bacterium]|nr:Mut7-C RNAse domain-containing protein [Spirochaetia bacterium]